MYDRCENSEPHFPIRKTTTTAGLFRCQHFAPPSWPSKNSVYSDLTLISAQSHLSCLHEQPEYTSSSKILHNCSICENYARCEDKTCFRGKKTKVTDQLMNPKHEHREPVRTPVQIDVDWYERWRIVEGWSLSWGKNLPLRVSITHLWNSNDMIHHSVEPFLWRSTFHRVCHMAFHSVRIITTGCEMLQSHWWMLHVWRTTLSEAREQLSATSLVTSAHSLWKQETKVSPLKLICQLSPNETYKVTFWVGIRETAHHPDCNWGAYYYFF